MSRIDNFVLFAPGGDDPPALPWAAELVTDAAHVARWTRLDGHVYGDGKVMVCNVWGLVTNHRDTDAVIDAFQAHDFGPHEETAVLLVHRDGGEAAEVYYRRGTMSLARRLGAGDQADPCEP